MSAYVSVTAATFERLAKHVRGKPEYRAAQRNGKRAYSPRKLLERIINEALDKAGAR